MSTTQGRLDEVDICNLALSHLGLPGISDSEFATPETKYGIVMRRYLRPTRNSMLTEHDWKFASVIYQLVIDSAVTIGGWEYIYTYPIAERSGTTEGTERIKKIFEDTTSVNPAKVEYKIFHIMNVTTGGKTVIATNTENAYAEITIVGDDEDTSTLFPGQGALTYPSLFIMAWSYLLAASSAYALVGTDERYNTLNSQHNIFFEKAKLADSNQGYIDNYDTMHTSKLISAR